MVGHVIKHTFAAGTMVVLAALLVGSASAVPAGATTGAAIHGGGSASDMTRFALAVQGGTGHFECLMPAAMTVEARVTGLDTINAAAASFHGTAQVTLAANNPFGLPGGPMATDAAFTASVTAGGPGTGFVDLEIMGMSFAGTVERGQITIQP
jgi:hypothetical protein